MEHVERAGVHSGDSMAIYPPLALSDDEISTIVDYTIRIGMLLNVRGLMNIQYVVLGGDSQQGPIRQNDQSSADGSTVYVLEVNPRSSRTVPFISKVTGVPLVHLAVNSMLGFSLKEQGYSGGLWKTQELVGIKAPVFSMSKLSGVDTHLGPEMKSTGEVMGIDYAFGPAVGKALLAAGLMLPSRGSILVSLSDKSKAESVPMLRKLADSNYTLYATEGTAVMLGRLGLPVKAVLHRLGAGHPNVVDVIREGVVDAVVNTITGDHGVIKDGFEIRRAAAEKRIPCFTSLDTAGAAVDNLAAGKNTYSVEPFPTYRSVRNRDL
jgi:carbamoyl-phosphate synthase large subunit